MALTTPFARNGNKKAVPQTTADGSVSYEQGFGNLYALPPEEGGLFIDRAQFNQLMYDTTEQVLANKTAIATKANTSEVVKLTTNQNIQGVKTFSVPPVSATNPKADNQVANKAYVDSVGNTAVKLTGTQRIEGAKTFTSDITAPNITQMQSSINTINTSLSTVVSDSFTPYLIVKTAPLRFKTFSLQDGAGQDEINTMLEQAIRYRFYRIYIYGTVTGNLSISQTECTEIIFDEASQAKLVGNLSLGFQSTARIISPTIQNGQLMISRYSRVYLVSGCNIAAPATKSAIEISSGSRVFTDVFIEYPLKPFNLTSDTAGIVLGNGSSFIANQGATINTTKTPTKIKLTRGSFASLNENTLSGEGDDFNITTNTVTANGIIMR